MNKLLFFSAGRGSKEVLKVIVESINKIEPTWEVLGFVDAEYKKGMKSYCNYPVFNPTSLKKDEDIYGICVVKDNTLRKKITENEIIENGFKLATLIHPSVCNPSDFNYGLGSIVYPSVKISHNVKIGKGVIVNYNSILGHDLIIKDYSFIGPSVTFTGQCKVGEFCQIGAGATFMEGVIVDSGSVVGLGSSIFSNVKKDTSVVDLPRKLVKRLKS